MPKIGRDFQFGPIGDLRWLQIPFQGVSFCRYDGLIL
jgi:hypothetical protein